jgi:prepilin-type N-terminal cleavage/methylation domain-containing protein
MGKRNRYFFSLIELMVVIAILTIVSTTVGIKISRAIADYEYVRSSFQIPAKLKFAKELSVVNQSDVYFTLSQKDSKIVCEIGFMEGKGDRKIKFHHLFSNIIFLFEPEGKPVIGESIAFIFTPNGEVSPRGILFFNPVKGSKNLEKKNIDFSEYFSRNRAL